MKLSIKIISLALCLCILLPLALGCGEGTDEYTSLSFKSTLDYDYLKELDGKPVTINGYIATSSPVDGSFIFLMNMPYQSCPFCVPNTSELSNTIEVYPKSGKKLDYTASAVKVKGTLEVAPEGEPFTDLYGYTFSFKIVDAEYSVLSSDEMGASFSTWENFSQSGVIDELYKMYDYLDFVCKWNTYYVNSKGDSSGYGYYLYASDAIGFITEGSYSYGTADGYFDSLIAKIEAIDKTAFSELVENINQAKILAAKAVEKLNNGEYTSEYKEISLYDDSGNVLIKPHNDYYYTINGGDQLKSELDSIYRGFEEWLGSWEV